MDFKELEKKTIDCAMNYGKRHNIKIDKDFALLKLYEEIGELTKNVLIYERKCRPEKYLSKEKSKKELAKEFADVLGVLIVVAHLFNIDLEEAISKKWINKKSKNNQPRTRVASPKENKFPTGQVGDTVRGKNLGRS